MCALFIIVVFLLSPLWFWLFFAFIFSFQVGDFNGSPEGSQVILSSKWPFHLLMLADLQEILVTARATLDVADDEVTCLHAQLVESDHHVAGKRCFLSL